MRQRVCSCDPACHTYRKQRRAGDTAYKGRFDGRIFYTKQDSET